MAEVTSQPRKYQHLPLQHPDSTRLLRLQPGHFEDNKEVELNEVKLSQQPRYEALSYVWGSRTTTDPISCHGQELFVTANCVSAMRHLRHEKKHRTLWIDAICINQESTDEWNHQVQLMGNVYSKAKRVKIWLGESTEDTDFAISFLNDYYIIHKWLAPIRRPLLRKKLQKLRDAELESARLSEKNNMLSIICNMPWFKRKWTIQEYVLSHDSYFQCGIKLLHASRLYFAINDMIWRQLKLWKEYRPYTTHAFASYFRVFEVVRQAFQNEGSILYFSLLDILRAGWVQIATEPRDAIFGMYGLLQRLGVSLPPVDYSKSVEQLCTEFGKLVILHDKSLRILEYTLENTTWVDLPSWVPDWSTFHDNGLERWPERLQQVHLDASASSRGIVHFMNDSKSLLVRGCFVGKIHSKAGCILTKTDFAEFRFPGNDGQSKSNHRNIHNISVFQDWIHMAKSLAGENGERHYKELLFSCLSNGVGFINAVGFGNGGEEEWLMCLESMPILRKSEDVEHSLPMPGTTNGALLLQNSGILTKSEVERRAEECSSILKNLESKPLAEDLFWWCYIYSKLNTRLFITSGDFLGKGLKAIREGDLVALIAGVDMPMILRKEGDSYRSKGPAYIHDMMNGEKWPKDAGELVDIILS